MGVADSKDELIQRAKALSKNAEELSMQLETKGSEILKDARSQQEFLGKFLTYLRETNKTLKDLKKRMGDIKDRAISILQYYYSYF